MKALYLVDSILLHQGFMFLCFHAFDQNPEAAIAQQADDIPQHRPTSFRLAVMEEGSIDLHRVELDEAKP